MLRLNVAVLQWQNLASISTIHSMYRYSSVALKRKLHKHFCAKFGFIRSAVRAQSPKSHSTCHLNNIGVSITVGFFHLNVDVLNKPLDNFQQFLLQQKKPAVFDGKLGHLLTR